MIGNRCIFWLQVLSMSTTQSLSIPWFWIVIKWQTDLMLISLPHQEAKWIPTEPCWIWEHRELSNWRNSTVFSSSCWWWRWYQHRALGSTRTQYCSSYQACLKQISCQFRWLQKVGASSEYRVTVHVFTVNAMVSSSMYMEVFEYDLDINKMK